MQIAKQIQLAPIAIKSRLDRYPSRICIHHATHIDILKPQKVLYAQALSNYCSFAMLDGRTIMTSKTLGSFQQILKENGFIRPHQSYIVNPDAVSQIIKRPSYVLVLTSKMEIPIARSRRKIIILQLTSKI